MSTFEPHEVAWTPEKSGSFWSYFSNDPKFLSQYFSNHSGGLLIEHLEKYVPFEGRVLDYGCGPGYLIRHLLQRGLACEGLDFSTGTVERVRAQFDGHPLFRGATVATQLPTPLEDASIDLLLSVEMVEHLFDEQLLPTFREFHRVLRPGGTLVVTTPNEEDLDDLRVLCPDCGALYHQYQHVRSWSAETLRAALEPHGFETVDCHATLIAPKLKGGALRQFLRRLRNAPEPPKPHLIYIGRRSQG